MKVLNLSCASGHVFEGWFASEEDFQGQLSRTLISCPLCADTQITKMLSAPRLNLTGARETPESRLATSSQEPSPSTDTSTQDVTPESSVAQPISSENAHQVQAQWLQMVRQVIANTEDVGSQFANEARKMHYGEVEPRHIRGQASPEQTKELLDEGIAVLPLPIPDALKNPLQ